MVEMCAPDKTRVYLYTLLLRLISVEEENHQVKLEMSELRARQRLELERVKRGKERELEEVHERVKQALARKEGNLKTLRSQHEVTTEKNNSHCLIA